MWSGVVTVRNIYGGERSRVTDRAMLMRKMKRKRPDRARDGIYRNRNS